MYIYIFNDKTRRAEHSCSQQWLIYWFHLIFGILTNFPVEQKLLYTCMCRRTYFQWRATNFKPFPVTCDPWEEINLYSSISAVTRPRFFVVVTSNGPLYLVTLYDKQRILGIYMYFRIYLNELGHNNIKFKEYNIVILLTLHNYLKLNSVCNVCIYFER